MAEALRYAVILEPDRLDGGFNVHIPAFPHAHTQGNDVDDALRNAREVIELEIEVMIERGETLPESDGDTDIRIERVDITLPAAGAYLKRLTDERGSSHRAVHAGMRSRELVEMEEDQPLLSGGIMRGHEHTCRQCEQDRSHRHLPYHPKIGHYPFWHSPCLECNAGIERLSFGGPWKCGDIDGPEFGDCKCGHDRSQHAEMKQSASHF